MLFTNKRLKSPAKGRAIIISAAMSFSYWVHRWYRTLVVMSCLVLKNSIGDNDLFVNYIFLETTFFYFDFLKFVINISLLKLKATCSYDLCSAEQEKDPEFWNSWAQRTLVKALKEERNTNIAKNLILFLGDGKCY